MIAETLKRFRSGDLIENDDLVAAHDHLEKLNGMLLPMGPTWLLAQETCIRDLNRARDLVKRRQLDLPSSEPKTTRGTARP